MKKFISKFICLLLCAMMSVSLVACKPDDTGSTGGNNQNVNNSKDAFKEFIDTYEETLRYKEVSDSETFFIQNNQTDYKLLINVEDETALKSAQEVQFFIADAYGFNIPIVYDTDPSVGDYDTSKKYISIGNTTFYKASPMNGTIKFDELGNDGYKIETYGNVVICNAYGNNGIVYVGYAFLEETLNYHYYAKDEWRITTEPNVKLKNIHLLDRPEFNQRSLDTATNSADNIDWIVRLRHHGSQGGRKYNGMEGQAWIGSDQSLCLQFLDCTQYQKVHPEWFTGDGASKSGQMCISTVMDNEPHAADGIRPFDEMVKNIIQGFIVPQPNVRVVMFGINDNATHQCRCEDCSAEVAQILYSGQMCLLLNAVKDALDAWQAGATEFPGGTPIPENLQVAPGSHDAEREIKLSFFAYLYCLESPTEYDVATDSYRPRAYDAKYKVLGGDGVNGDGDYSDVTLREDILVRIAPIESVNMHTHFDREYNEPAYQAFETWSQICSEMAVWDYGTTFSDYISPYPDWGIIVDDFKYFRSKNVTELLTQLPAHTSGTSFFALMLYVRAQLMWDMDQDIEFLIKDFFMNYYGPQAFDAMYGYFTFLRNYIQMADGSYINEEGQEVKGFINANGNKVEYHGYIYEVFTTERWFPMTTLMQLKSFFTEAEAQLALVKETEPKYQKYLDRVQVESLFTRYIDLKNYRSYYSNEQLAEMTDEFDRLAKLGNLTQFSNAGKNGVQQVRDFIANLRKSIN